MFGESFYWQISIHSRRVILVPFRLESSMYIKWESETSKCTRWLVMNCHIEDGFFSNLDTGQLSILQSITELHELKNFSVKLNLITSRFTIQQFDIFNHRSNKTDLFSSTSILDTRYLKSCYMIHICDEKLKYKERN